MCLHRVIDFGKILSFNFVSIMVVDFDDCMPIAMAVQIIKKTKNKVFLFLTDFEITCKINISGNAVSNLNPHLDMQIVNNKCKYMLQTIKI